MSCTCGVGMGRLGGHFAGCALYAPSHPESRFTEPRPECPAPGYWHSTDGDSTEDEVTDLVAGFVRALQPAVVVETGTAFGRCARRIGEALAQNGHGRLWTLEPDPRRAKAAAEWCEGLPVNVILTKSLLWQSAHPIDFAWFDSLTPLRVAEFHHFRPRMNINGRTTIVGFHDTGPQHEPLRSQIEELDREGLIETIFLPTPRGVCFAEVL